MQTHKGPLVASDVVQVVARGADVAFVINENAPFDVVTAELKEYLANQSGLWSRGDITLNVGQRMLARDELAQIKSIIETKSGLTVTRFWFAPESMENGVLQVEAKPPKSADLTTSVAAVSYTHLTLPTNREV